MDIQFSGAIDFAPLFANRGSSSFQYNKAGTGKTAADSQNEMVAANESILEPLNQATFADTVVGQTINVQA